jgi:hypothetical protein
MRGAKDGKEFEKIYINKIDSILSDKFNPIKSNVIELSNFLGVNPLEIIEVKNENKR